MFFFPIAEMLQCLWSTEKGCSSFWILRSSTADVLLNQSRLRLQMSMKRQPACASLKYLYLHFCPDGLQNCSYMLEQEDWLKNFLEVQHLYAFSQYK